MTPEELANSSSWYSEIQLVNIKDSNSKNTYFAKKPDFIVVYNKPSEGNIRESKERGIPIVIINEQRLKDDKKIDIDKNMGMYDDIYINNSYDEDNSEYEDRYDTIGDLSAGIVNVSNNADIIIGNNGRDDVLFVVYTERIKKNEDGVDVEVTRLISARCATNFERGLYYGKY